MLSEILVVVVAEAASPPFFFMHLVCLFSLPMRYGMEDLI